MPISRNRVMFNGIQLRPTPNNRELGLKSLFFCSILNFYRTQVSLGSSLWVPVSVSNKGVGQTDTGTQRPPHTSPALSHVICFNSMHWRLLHLNLLHRIHLKVLQSTIRLVGPQWVHHRQYLSPRPLWECNFERNRCNKLCHFENTQCRRCLRAQCEVLVPFYRLLPCGVHRTILDI